MPPPHDLPDWGALNSVETVIEITDLGELAARLFSIDTFERGGDVVWMDDFENEVGVFIPWATVGELENEATCAETDQLTELNKWIVEDSGGFSTVRMSTCRARNGLWSCRLTATVEGDGFARVIHLNPYPRLSNMGVEFSVSLGPDAPDVQLSTTINTFGDAREYTVRYLTETAEVQVFVVGEGWVTVRTGVFLDNEATLFHTWKLVFDAVNHRYLRFVLDETTFDLSALPEQGVTEGGGNNWRVAIMASLPAGGASDVDAWVDDVILTQNERP